MRRESFSPKKWHQKTILFIDLLVDQQPDRTVLPESTQHRDPSFFLVDRLVAILRAKRQNELLVDHPVVPSPADHCHRKTMF